MLQLDGSTQRVSATQTDFQDSTEAEWSKVVNAETQTLEDWSLQRAHDLVRSNDEQLVELITEIENAKLQAQSDFKFAVVQMEQRLREEYEAEVRQKIACMLGSLELNMTLNLTLKRSLYNGFCL